MRSNDYAERTSGARGDTTEGVMRTRLRPWATAGLPALAVAAACLVHCGRLDTQVGAAATEVFIEAEEGALAGGFVVQMDPTASGDEYILPPDGVRTLQTPGSASASYSFVLGATDQYYVWGRIHAPGADNNAFWVSVDGGPEYLWRLSTGVVWVWGRVTNGTEYGKWLVFDLAAGPHTLVFRNADPGVGLDAIYVRPTSAKDLDRGTPCDPPNSIQLTDGTCQKSCGSFGAYATCGPACAGLTALPAYDCTVCCLGPPDAGGDAAADAAASDN